MPHYYYIIVITVHNNFLNNLMQVLASFPPSNFIVSIICLLFTFFPLFIFLWAFTG